ncbi:DUF1491 family protein [Bartonella sp. DGB2]|uniref:DUF1491 family protein n=1 Tax=Bartonella sp. DGB2 TaxID=3388426 RepID=UPI00398FDBFF
MRLSSEFWVASFLHQVRLAGGFATLVRRGALAAGAIFILYRDQNYLFNLYTPAPQSAYGVGQDISERLFTARFIRKEEDEINIYLGKELRFDPDLWIIEAEALTVDVLPLQLYR